jgi:hypothetical protein
MGNQASEEKDTWQSDRTDGQKEPASPSFTSEVKELLEIANTTDSLDVRVSACIAVYERLLKPDAEDHIWNHPRFRLITIEKAYEVNENPLVAATVQEFLYKFHPEAFGIPCPPGCELSKGNAEEFEQWPEEKFASGEDLNSEDEEAVACAVQEHFLKNHIYSTSELKPEVESDEDWPEEQWIALSEGSKAEPKPKLEVTPEMKPEVKSEVKLEVKPEVKSDEDWSAEKWITRVEGPEPKLEPENPDAELPKSGP